MGSGRRGKSKGSAFCAVKYVFIVFSILVWLLGFGVLSVGVWMHINCSPYTDLLPDTIFMRASVLIICAGAITLVVGFCGCCGAILESQCMLVVYFVFVLVIFGLEITATALGVSHKSEIQMFLHDEVVLSLKRDYRPEYEGTPRDGVVAVMDTIQQDLECCGLSNSSDWYNIDAWPNEKRVPVSCCVEPAVGCGEPDSGARLYTRGCLKEVEYWFYKNMYTLGILGLVIAVVQVLAMTASVAMFCCLRKNKSIL